MNAFPLIAARVTPETKERFASVARARALSESALLKQLMNVALLSAPVADAALPSNAKTVPVAERLSVRLRCDDVLLLRERATARGLPTSGYASLLIRAHLRSMTPLPSAELAALKASVAELGAIGRNLNQIARAMNQGVPGAGASVGELRALLRACEGLRDHVKALIRGNQTSWSNGYETAGH